MSAEHATSYSQDVAEMFPAPAGHGSPVTLDAGLSRHELAVPEAPRRRGQRECQQDERTGAQKLQTWQRLLLLISYSSESASRQSASATIIVHLTRDLSGANWGDSETISRPECNAYGQVK